MTRKKIFRAKTAADLKAAVYAHHGWTPVYGENRSARVLTLYDVHIDHKREQIVATAKGDAQKP